MSAPEINRVSNCSLENYLFWVGAGLLPLQAPADKIRMPWMVKKPKVLHYYDSVRGATACGSPADDRSTFTVFREEVTCAGCLKIAGQRQTAAEVERFKQNKPPQSN